MAGASLIFVIFIFVYGIAILVSLAMAVLQIVATWKLYEKAGEPGWSSIVPVYYYMQQIKIATGSYKLAWVYIGTLVVYLIGCIAFAFTQVFENPDVMETAQIIWMVFYLIMLVPLCGIAYYVSYKFAKAYGKSQAFCILSIFFPQIMIIIMGFDKSTQYVGPKGVPLYNNSDKYNNYY